MCVTFVVSICIVDWFVHVVCVSVGQLCLVERVAFVRVWYVLLSVVSYYFGAPLCV